MRLAFSNIAWLPAEDDAIARELAHLRFDAVEIAPTRYWPRPVEVKEREAIAVREAWMGRGFEIVIR